MVGILREGGIMSKTRTCHICGTITDTWCPTCIMAYPNRRIAHEMTGDERAAEMEMWRGNLEIPFDLLHERIEELVGRPVWTHEMAKFEELIEEARTWNHIGMGEVLDKALAYGKPVIPVVLNG
jgi:hypothetical protein